MTIGVNTWVWVSPLTTQTFRALAPKISAMGFDLVEVTLETTDDLDAPTAAAIAEDLGLSVSVCAVIPPDRDLIHPDEHVRKTGFAYVRRCIEAAAVLGAANVIGPLYSGVGRLWRQTAEERERDLVRLTAQLRTLAEYAASHDVTLCVEPLNRFETSFINTTAQVVELVDRVAHPACRLMLDTFHMNIEERSLGAAIRAAGPRLRHLHVCENDRGTPGSGHIAWTEVAEACRDIGFEGPFVIESFTSGVESIARAAAVWRPFAPSQDALARDGLAFLRDLLAG